MSLSLKENKTFLTSKGITMSEAFIATIDANYSARTFTLGIFASKDLFIEAFSKGQQREWAIDVVEITMTPEMFAQYFYSPIEREGQFLPLDLMNEIFTTYLIEQKPKPNGRVPIPDPEDPTLVIENPNGKIEWDDWEQDAIIGVPATMPQQ